MQTPTLPRCLQNCPARIAIVLGSGLGSFAEAISHETVIPYGDIEGLPISRVPGHAGRLLLGTLDRTPLLVAQGRVHLYEGWNATEVTSMVRLFHAAGVHTVVLTNAAGSVNPAFAPGSWMMLNDHINLTGESPLRGGAHFIDMTEVYDRGLRETFRKAASDRQMPLGEGVYLALPGPQYETPAEIRMIQRLGADAVGMSTVLETIQARALGLRVAGFSCLTNWGAGLGSAALHHEEVTEVGQKAASSLCALLADVLPGL